MAKRCPLGTGRDCMEERCAWYLDTHTCAVAAMVPKLDAVARSVQSLDDTLLGYDQQGMLVKVRQG